MIGKTTGTSVGMKVGRTVGTMFGESYESEIGQQSSPEPSNNQWLKQNERHLLRQTALVKLQLRTDHDHRTARVVDFFSKQVLAQSATLPFEHVAQRLQGAISCTGQADRAGRYRTKRRRLPEASVFHSG